MEAKRVVLLVLASSSDVYDKARMVWKKYMYLDEDVGVYFVYGKLSGCLPSNDDHDLIYEDLDENYENMIHKRLRATQYIHEHVRYDYFIYTNISTFWNWKALHEHLDTLPKSNC